jgi:hypothetical protein
VNRAATGVGIQYAGAILEHHRGHLGLHGDLRQRLRVCLLYNAIALSPGKRRFPGPLRGKGMEQAQLNWIPNLGAILGSGFAAEVRAGAQVLSMDRGSALISWPRRRKRRNS